jgi:hypothetical protein
MEWISVDDRLPEDGLMVALMDKNRYTNNPINIKNEHVVQCGYINDFHGRYWSIYGERAMEIKSFTHWCELPLVD